MPEFELTPELLGSVAGIILSLAFSYIPGLNEIFAGLSKQLKSLVMLVLILIVAAGIFALSCGGIITAVTCDQAGLEKMIWTFVLTLIANQSTYMLSPETKTVIEAKLRRDFSN